MKTFDDLIFERHKVPDGVTSSLQFDNGYGVSVVSHGFSYGGEEGLYELAVLNKDNELVYDTPVTSDVLGWLTPEDVTRHMREVQELEAV